MTAPGRLGRRAANLGRHTGVSLGLVTASVAIHVSAGGTPPDSCLAVAALLALSSLVTGIATYLADRTRGAGTVLVTFGLGQLVMSGLLTAPGTDHGAVWSWPAALLHAATSVLLAVGVLGLGRVMLWLGELAERVLPRCWWSAPSPVAIAPSVAIPGLRVRAGRRACTGTASRAPPVLL